MRSLRFLLLAVFVLQCATIHGWGSPALDAPAAKKVTVETEIQRGAGAIRRDTILKDVPLANESFFRKVVYENQQRNTDTPAFMIGASMAMLEVYATLEAQGIIVFTKERLEAIEEHQKEVTGLAKAYGLSEEDLALGCEMSPEKVRRLMELGKAE